MPCWAASGRGHPGWIGVTLAIPRIVHRFRPVLVESVGFEHVEMSVADEEEASSAVFDAGEVDPRIAPSDVRRSGPRRIRRDFQVGEEADTGEFNGADLRHTKLPA
jgi:hypothetical protein